MTGGQGVTLPVVAIDGRSATGKTTIGHCLAARLDLEFLDSGRVYRLITHLLANGTLRLEAVTDALASGAIDVDGSTAYHHQKMVDPRYLNDTSLGDTVAQIACLPEVRAPLTAWIRHRALTLAPVVVVGRDIGTDIFPDAGLKVFLKADDQTRFARRIGRDSGRAGETALAMQRRDQLDETRSVAPMRPAPDAVIVDTGVLSIEESVTFLAYLYGGLHLVEGDAV